MPSKYTILQFLPNPTSGERVNIGVVAYSESGGYVRFLSRWDRVKSFAGCDISFLKELSKVVIGRVDALTRAVRDKFVAEFDPSDVEAWAARWSYGVEFTPPRASLLEPTALLNDLCTRMLAEPAPERRIGRDRAAAAKVAAHTLRVALEQVVGVDAETLLKKNYKLPGKHQPHKFDAAVANGVPYVAASGISFEGPYSERIEPFYDQLAWSVSDIGAVAQALPVAVVALPPIPDTPDYKVQKANFDRKAKLYAALGADFLTETEYPDWATRVVSRLPIRRSR